MGDYQWFRFYPRSKDGSPNSNGGYYYVVKLPDDFTPGNVESRNPDYCHPSYHYECMAFPDISYIIVHSFYDNVQVRMDVYYPKAISQANYNIKALVWQNNRYRGVTWITMNSNCQNDYRGSLVSYSGVSTVEYSNALNLNRRKLQVKIQFQVRHVVPEGGTIQVVWPSKIPEVYPHCRSMTNIGSNLFAKDGNENGEIGCQVQNTRQWVVTEFA